MEAAEFEKHEQLEATHWWFEGRRRCIDAVLRRHLRPAPNRRVLDVGCGTGGMFPLLAGYGQVAGAEFSSDARARAARRFPGITVSPCALPHEVPLGPFELVTAFDVIEHLDEPVEALKTLAGRLAEGGQLVVTVPAFQFLWSEHDVSLQHRRRYSLALLREHLAAAGFEVKYDSYFNTGLFPAVALARLVGRVLPQRRVDSDLKPAPRPLNAALTTFFGGESHFLKRSRLPVGVSLIAVAERQS
jgi:SAM-dependent methyltransferase